MTRPRRHLILLSTLGLLACSGSSPAGSGGGTGGHAGAAGSNMPAGSGGASGHAGGAGGGAIGGASGAGGGAVGGSSGAGGGATGGTTGGAGGSGTGGAAGAAGTSGASGNGDATGAGGAGGQAGAGGAPGNGGLSVSPSAATFANTLVEAVSASQTFTVRNDGNATTTLAAAFDGTNAADFRITANGCGGSIDVGASCEIKVAFGPKTRSGSRSARLAVSNALGVATASLNATALPSLGLLAGVLGGGPGNVDGIGPAAHFRYPSGIATDGAGNLYVADSYNYAVRKIVIATGAVTTLATNIPQPVGVAADGAGNVFVTSDGNAAVRKIAVATGTVTTLAGTPDLSYPRGIACDGAGNLYVTAAAHAVQKIVIATGVVTTIVAPHGTSPEDFAISAPFIVADGAGNLFVDDGTQMQKVVIATGAVSPLVDSTGVPVVPGPMANDGAGNILFGNNTIRKFVIATGAITALTDRMGAPIDAPSGLLAADAGGVYVLGNDSTIWKIAGTSGAVTGIAGGSVHTGSADGVGAAAGFNRPYGIASDGAGNVYVADGNNYTIRKIVVATGTVSTFAGAAGVAGTVDGTGTAARFAVPGALAFDGGNLYVADDNRIRKIVLATGEVTALVGVPGPGGSRDGTGTSAYFYGPAGIAADGAGNLYVSDSTNYTIRKVVIATRVVTTLAGSSGTWGSTDATGTNALFDGPYGIAFDAGNLYVADLGNHTIRKIVIATRVVTTPGWMGVGASAPYGGPQNVVADGAGNLYVNDFSSNVFTSAIRKVALDTGSVSTVIGSFDRVGVSLGALPASLCTSSGLAVLPTGELAIVATNENSILIGHL